MQPHHAMMAESEQSNDSSYFVVCAVDFGTTNSGFAYSFMWDVSEIIVPEKSHYGVPLFTQKTPTSLLLDHSGKFVAFGYEAESRYADLEHDEDHLDYFYRQNALLDLRNEELTMNTTFKDVSKRKEIHAIEVFCHMIKYFRDCMMTEVNFMGYDDEEESEIMWVLTVPAIWSDPAKQVLTEAAKRAGISRTKLILALEPEATCLYISRLYVPENPDVVGIFTEGKPFLLIDAGGEKVDFTVLEVTRGNELKILEKTRDWKCGGSCVDLCFEEVLKEVFGKDVMDAFCQSNPEERIELSRFFELRKKASISATQTMVTMKIPEVISDIHKIQKGYEITEAIKKSEYNQNMKWEGRKMRITRKLFETLFNKACKGIIQNINNILEKPMAKKVVTILMVGGFSSSSILQNQIKTNFPFLKIVVPHDAGLVSLKGAVLYGHNLRIMSTRIEKLSDGVASRVDGSDKDDHKIRDKSRMPEPQNTDC